MPGFSSLPLDSCRYSVAGVTNLHDFGGPCDDGKQPEGGVAVMGTKVVGTASDGGTNGDGTIWSFDTLTDTFTNIHNFGPNEGTPYGDVAVSGDTLYGT